MTARYDIFNIILSSKKRYAHISGLTFGICSTVVHEKFDHLEEVHLMTSNDYPPLTIVDIAVFEKITGKQKLLA